MSLRGVGVQNSWKFVHEFFGWRQFKNGKEVGSLAGLTPTPYDSGGSRREQGISKAGNKRIRTLAYQSFNNAPFRFGIKLTCHYRF